MKVLHLLGAGRLSTNPDSQALSGLTRSVLNLARSQAANGHEVSVMTFDSVHWTTTWNGVTIEGLPPVSWAKIKFGNINLDYRKHLSLIRFIALRDYDVVQGHNYAYLRFLRSKLRIITFHGDPGHYGWTSRDFAIAHRFSTHLIAVSDFIATTVSSELRLPKEAVPVVYNGVDMSSFNASEALVSKSAQWRRKLGITPDQPVFLYAGAISVEKGVRELALAFRDLVQVMPQAVLVIAGSSHIWGGSADRRLMTPFELDIHQILTECPHNVRFLDNVSGQVMPIVYNMADIVVVPSTVREGFGLVALESLACGRPVIASRVGGLPEVVDSSCGLLVEPGSPDVLYRAMQTLANKPSLRRRLGHRGIVKAQAFTWQRAVRTLDAVYQA